MAIKLNFIWRGVNVPQAYVRIDHISGGKREPRGIPPPPGQTSITAAIWMATAGIYADPAQGVPILTLNLTASLTDANETPFVALYAALKALPEFAGAVDC